MLRINTNISSLIAQHRLHQSNEKLTDSLQHLSTGLSINRGADNPAGLIVSERLRSEVNAVQQAIANSERAVNVIATTEAALQEISHLLTSMRALVLEAANTGAFSQQEIEANQLQIDSAVESITRIANTTSFAGMKTLDGSLDYRSSGVDAANLQDLKVFGANFGTNATLPVTVDVLASAQTASLFVSGNTAGSPGALLSSVTLEVQGTLGVDVFQFTSGTALSAVVFRINSTSDATGLNASLVNSGRWLTGADQTSGMLITSTSYGSDAFVSVRKLTGGDFFQTFNQQGGSAINYDAGQDVLAMVNGNMALGDGRQVTLYTPTLNLQMMMTVAAATTVGLNTAFTITGGGAAYQIGQFVDANNQVGFGIQSVASTRLGNQTDGFLSSIRADGPNSLITGQANQAERIIRSAIDQIAIQRGRLGAFERNTLRTTIRSQQIAVENLAAAESHIRDTDFAAETSALSRAQILVNAGTSVLALANNSAQNVLALLQ